jgi:hypothetical protein
MFLRSQMGIIESCRRGAATDGGQTGVEPNETISSVLHPNKKTLPVGRVSEISGASPR